AILGVLPIAFGVNLELLNHETTLGAPSTQWWISLSSAIVFGLAFSTVLTLVVTPSALMIFTRGAPRRKRRGLFARLFRRKAAEPASPDDNPVPVIGDEDVTAFPKAAE
ncbi:MAG: AcrB/AcrD/AcrF family protein, partial [Rhizobiaceae bacterium]